MIKTINRFSDHIIFFEGVHHKPSNFYNFVIPDQSIDFVGLANTKEGETVLNILSSNKKLYLAMYSSIYPFLCQLDSLLKFYEDKEMFENVEAIIDIKGIKDQSYNGWVTEILDKKQIKYQIVDTENYDYVNVNDFFIIAGTHFKENGIFYNFYENTLDFVLNDNLIKPFRKVFISRKFAYSCNTNIRIDDHEKLEKIFLDNGFEICYPELQFKTFSEQVTYFNETKVLCGLSGGGLTNSVFMQSKGKIFELLTSFKFDYPLHYNEETDLMEDILVEELHEYYLHIAFQRKHLYTTLSNIDRKVDIIEEELKKTGIVEWLTKYD
jgi:hypothetical protein